MGLKVGDRLPGVFPTTFTPEERGEVPPGKASAWTRKIPVRAVVEWIHPEGRFVVIRFCFDSGLWFRECRILRRKGQ